MADRTLKLGLPCAVILAVAGSFAFASDVDKALLTAVIGLVCGVAGWFGVARRSPASARAWQLICAGVALNSIGVLVEVASERWWSLDVSPTPADAFYLALYPCVGAGMALLIRARRRSAGGGSVLDAAVLSVGLALLCWVLLIRPAAPDPEMALFGRMVTYAYPLGDLALVTMLARLLIAGRRSAAVMLLSAGLACFLATDVAWSLINQCGADVSGSAWNAVLTAVPLIGYACCGAAALAVRERPTAVTSDADERPVVSNWLLVMLTAALLVAPGVLLVEASLGAVRDAIAIGISAGCLSLLVALRLAQVVRALQRQSARLRTLSLTDPLTGLVNRRDLETRMPELLRQAARRGAPLSVVGLDLDHFKDFNDRFGHGAGDDLLRRSAAAWSDVLRAGDVIARLGGEEFLVVLIDTGLDDAAALCRRLLEVTPLGQTFSAGIALWDGTEDSDRLLARADEAMYEAKGAGRNRSAIAA